MKTKLQIAIESLKEIQEIGYNSGYAGYSCARKAEIALHEIENAQENLTRDQQVEDINNFKKDIIEHPEYHAEFIKEWAVKQMIIIGDYMEKN